MYAKTSIEQLPEYYTPSNMADCVKTILFGSLCSVSGKQPIIVDNGATELMDKNSEKSSNV